MVRAVTWFVLFAAGTLHVESGRGPLFITEPPNRVEFSNSTGVVIPCVATGEPQPTIRWIKKDGTLVSNIPGLRQIRHDGSLMFHSFSVERFRQDVHLGVYHCLATNPSGTIRSRDVTVIAVVLQHFEVHVTDSFVIRGNTAVLRCHLPALTKDYIQVTLWTRDDGITLGSPGFIGDKYTVLHSGELLIKNASPTDTYRTYSCQVRHRLSSQTKSSQTPGKIIVREPHTTLPPTIAEIRNSVHGRDDDRVELPCVGQGYPIPSVTWAKREGDLIVSLQASQRILQKSGSLIFQRVRVQDSGTYICIVNNTIGQESGETKLIISAPLSVTIDPRSQVADVGKKAIIRCRTSGHPLRMSSFYKNGLPLITSSRVILIAREVVQIFPVQREDKGMFQCFAINDIETIQATAELLIGEELPVFVHKFQETLIKPGKSISLKCSASGNPLPQITWTLDGHIVPESYNIRIGDYVSDERTVNSYVNISSVGIEDGGSYACEALNEVGRTSHKQRLNVYGPPFIRDMDNMTVLDGQEVVMNCPVSGYPIDKIIWEKDGRLLPQNHRQKSLKNGTLFLSDVERMGDGGTYFCSASNNQGRSASKNITLLILAPPVVEPFAFPNDLTEGRRASVACVVSAGDLPIQIHWLKDGIPPASELKSHINQANDYTSLLSIPSVKQWHTGNYTCVATNPAASTNYTAPMIVHVAPRWKREPTDQSAVMGHQVVFDCQAIGYPDPVIRWKKAVAGSDYQGIISGETIQTLENGSLVIREVSKQDSNHYMCQATNDVGPGLSRVIRLTVHGELKYSGLINDH